jgi:hypothetical protein
VAPARNLEHARGNLVLQAKDAQRRAALAGAVECGGEDVGHDLLGQRARIHEHRVEAPRLGDERDERAVAGREARD